jgi:hypothetical protein
MISGLAKCAGFLFVFLFICLAKPKSKSEFGKSSNMAKEALNDQEDPEDGKKKQTADERKRMRLADLKFLFHDKRDEITEADEVS